MTRSKEKGVTLIELLVSITILGIIAMAAMPLLSISLESHRQGTDTSRLYQEGLLAMERMTNGVRRCTYLLIPNAHAPVRDILAFSGTVNDDDDYYFNDTLFPRIDEDSDAQMTDDDKSGIKTLDDDGDAFTDEGGKEDDDEDGVKDEDPLDGIDNDGDGNIDEDSGGNNGIAGMDDDADGSIDEENDKDDDEDGDEDEDPLNPLIYSWNSATNTLTETSTHDGTSAVLSTRVVDFEVEYNSPADIRVKLKLAGDDGKVIEFIEHACPRNTLQKTGKRVR